jgi:hypothetical protein
LLSAYMAGLVYGRLALAKARIDAIGWHWRQARKVLRHNTALLFSLFTVIAVVGVTVEQPAVERADAFYLAEPWRFIGQPGAAVPLLEHLPMYVLFMLASPVAAWVPGVGGQAFWRSARPVGAGTVRAGEWLFFELPSTLGASAFQ